MRPELNCYDLGPRVTAFSTTRRGGYSEGNYGELNVNAYCGDSPEAIRKNRELLCEWLQCSDIILPHQVHGTVVRAITPSLLSLSPDERQQQLEGVDAVMTDVKGVCIGVSTADCIPIILYDPQHNCAAVVHAGWRGTVARIAEKAVAAMQQTYHSVAAQMQAVVGPGISLDAFEVGQEVYDQFAQAGFPMDAIARQQAKWHIDLPRCNQMQLESCGIPASAIRQTGICTYSNSDRYFSARRLGIASGRICTAIVIH